MFYTHLDSNVFINPQTNIWLNLCLLEQLKKNIWATKGKQSNIHESQIMYKLNVANYLNI